MNPPTLAAASPASLLHDVAPPVKIPVAANPVAGAAPVQPEVVQSIPVRSPSLAGSPAAEHQMTAPNPIAAAVDQPQAASTPAPKGDKDLDKDLRTVNRQMKVTDAYEQKQAVRKQIPGLKMDTKLALPVGAALLVAGALLFLTISTFRHPTTAVRTRATTGSLVSPPSR